MGDRPLTLEWLPGRYAVCRLDADQSAPSWAQAGAKPPSGGAAPGQAPALLSITRTDRELSIVIEESLLPAKLEESIKVQRGFVLLRIAGTLDFSEVGILARLTTALAEANVPVFVISTFETDFLLTPAQLLDDTIARLQTVAGLPANPL